ncbi:hypothetical protein L0Y65_02345 [Candidatus Micrarchaeota archaeon]|nr:hypothetical protein [Candidatus Micrarchaeota archaeon]
MKLRQAEGSRTASRRSFSLREPLIAVSLAIPLLLGCRGSPNTAEQPSTPAQSVRVPEPEIPHLMPSGPAYKAFPSQSAPGAPSAAPALSAPSSALSPDEAFPALSGIIARRVAQSRAKMKLTPEEGELAMSYLRSDLASSQSIGALASRMPKTTIELLRAMHERGVTREDAEGIAGYLNRMLDSMRLSKVDTFDTCCSHVLGRRWSQIDYSGERLDAASQERSYASRGVPDLLTSEHVRRYFAVESKMPYFRRLFNPQGPLPE